MVFHRRILPFFGSYVDIAKYAATAKNHLFVDFCQDIFFKNKERVPDIVGIALSNTLCLMVNRPEPAEEIFLSKNKYFDKHPLTKEVFKMIAGDSIVFARSDMLW